MKGEKETGESKEEKADLQHNRCSAVRDPAFNRNFRLAGNKPDGS